jgi:hypothetical protein
VSLVLAAARGISAASDATATGTVAVLRALLVILPRSAEELLGGVDLDDFRTAVAPLDDSAEPISAPPGTAPWTVQVAVGEPDGWDDTRP